MEEMRQFLPLKVTAAGTDPDGIVLSGDRWRLRVNTNWRISQAGKLILSSSTAGDLSAGYKLEDIVGDEIIEFGVQAREVGFDLSVRTLRGWVLEIFSDFSYGEWIFSAWQPGDRRQTPIFDLEGPVVDGLY